MYAVPMLAVLLALVLFAASRTVRKDVDALHAWTVDGDKDSSAARTKADLADLAVAKANAD